MIIINTARMELLTRSLTQALQRPRPAPSEPTDEPAVSVSPDLQAHADDAIARDEASPLAEVTYDQMLALVAANMAAASPALALFGPISGEEAAELTEPPAAEGAPEEPDGGPPILPDTVELGEVAFEEVQSTTSDEGSTQATGVLDLSEYGLGRQRFDLELDESGAVTGASSQETRLDLGLGGHGLVIEGEGGGSLLRIDEAGVLTAAGAASFEFLGESRQLGDAVITFHRDGDRTRVEVDGDFEIEGNPTDVQFSFDSEGAVSAEVGMEAATEFAPFLTGASEFLELVGVDVTTYASFGFDVDRSTGDYSVHGGGIDFAWSAADETVAIGGLSAAYGVSVGLESLVLDTGSGEVEGSLEFGVGVGVGELGVSFDFAGFDFSFDPGTGTGTLSGMLGVGAANISQTADFQFVDGELEITDTRFESVLDTDALSKAAASAMSSAVAEGQARVDELRQQIDFATARGLGDDFLLQAGRSADALGDFLGAAQASQDQLSDFLGAADDLAGASRTRFRAAAAAAPDGAAFVRDFRATQQAIGALGSQFSSVQVDRAGQLTASFQVPGGNRTSLTFGMDDGQLTAEGDLRIGGRDFGSAAFEFSDSGLASVDAQTRLSYRGTGVTFSAGLRDGVVEATGSLSVRFWGRSLSVGLRLGSDGIHRV